MESRSLAQGCACSSALLVLATIAVACGGEGSAPPGSGEGGSGGAGGGSPNVEGPAAANATATGVSTTTSSASVATTGGGSGGDEERPLALRAYLNAVSYEYESSGEPAMEAYVSAFVFAFPEDPFNTCSSESSGDCVFTRCDYRDPGEDEWVDTSGVWQDAGPITYEGPTGTRTLEQDLNGYVTFTSPELLFEGGEPVSFSSPGGSDLPAFDVDLVAPNRIEVTEPAFAGLLTISGAVDIEWTGGGAGSVQVYVRTAEWIDGEIGHVEEVMCLFDAAAGRATIPAALVDALPRTNEDIQGYLSVGTFSYQRVDVGGGLFEVRATNTAHSELGADGFAAGYARLQ